MSKIKNLLYRLLTNPLVVGREKAVAAGLAAWLASFVVQHFGYHVSDGLQQVVISSALAALAHIVVYLTPNRS